MPRHPRRLAASALAGLACLAAPAVLVATASTAALAKKVAVCGLASESDVHAAYGGNVGHGDIDSSIPSLPACLYEVRASNLGIGGTAVVFVTPGEDAATFAAAKKTVPGARPVRGLGSDAFYNPSTTTVQFIKHGEVVNAQAIFFSSRGPKVNPARVESDTIALAKAVAKHL